ncbi:unnamed protein product [Trichobilharzia regenti]|nr:unnamed protein product [Trichobilharzia regenti]
MICESYAHLAITLYVTSSLYAEITSFRGQRDHQLRLHPNCVLYSSTSRWPAYILFTNVFLTPNLDDGNNSGKIGNFDKNDPSSTCVSGVSVIQPDWLLELAPHYYQFGTDREHLEHAIRSKQ